MSLIKQDKATSRFFICGKIPDKRQIGLFPAFQRQKHTPELPFALISFFCDVSYTLTGLLPFL
jgi:hypothetical protein